MSNGLSNYAARLAQVGRKAEAVAAGEEAVTLYRELAAANRAAFLPGLASSVHNFALALVREGRQAEALHASEEAVRLHRELVNGNRAAFLPSLAASIHNHALRLSEAGRRDEALTTSDEAVRLRDELVTANRDAFLPDLASSLLMFARIRQTFGTDVDRAVSLARRAELIFAELAARTPGFFDAQLTTVRLLLGQLRPPSGPRVPGDPPR